jgi:penicillin-binding protein 1A
MTPRRRRKERARRGRRVKGRVWKIAIAVVLALAGGAVATVAVVFAKVSNDIGPLPSLDAVRLGENTRIYDREGRLLGRIAGATNRTVVPSTRIPEHLKQATVAIEDKRFYKHEGVDYYRLMGAAVRDVTTNGPRQGGSTITMQLVKNLWFPKAARTAEQKVKEVIWARDMEERLTKDEILTTYLNGVFYGNNAIGVQAASFTYFDEDVKNITLPQAALLAGLPQAPSDYNPFVDPVDAKARRNLVIDQMAGQGMITRKKADQAKKAGLGLKRGKAYEPRAEGYFFEYVRKALIDEIGKVRVQRGGWRVETTLDPKYQKWAQDTITSLASFPDAPAAAVVMIDARTGYIRAMATSRTYAKDSQFNYATSATRQPGSTFKVFVLSEAIKQGINPNTTSYVGRTITLPEFGNHTVRGGGGLMNLASATRASNNSIFTQLAVDVGLQDFIDTAYDMGIPKERGLEPLPSNALGGLKIGVTPLDMAIGYAPLANGGYRVKPVGVQKIFGRDAARYRDIATPKRERVMTDGQAYEITKILRSNVTGGTGTRAAISGYAIAGKTGTTENNVDSWFVGYTPEFVTAVWVGYPNDNGIKRYMNNVPGWGAMFGGKLPAAIWHDFMVNVVEDRGPKDWSLPKQPASWSPFTSSYIQFARTYEETTESTESEGTTTKKKPGAGTTTFVPRPDPGVTFTDIVPPAETVPPLVEPPPAAPVEPVPPPVEPVAPPPPVEPVPPPVEPPPAVPPGP